MVQTNENWRNTNWWEKKCVKQGVGGISYNPLGCRVAVGQAIGSEWGEQTDVKNRLCRLLLPSLGGTNTAAHESGCCGLCCGSGAHGVLGIIFSASYWVKIS